MIEQESGTLSYDSETFELRGRESVAAVVLAEQIGRFEPLSTPFGVKPLVYADWTASARSLRHVETFVSRQVLPYYGNTHTAASACGAQSSSFVAEARRVVGDFCGARTMGKAACDVVLFCGAGTTSAVNQLVSILGVIETGSAVVLVGPYEHHSNLLPWREAGAAVETVLAARSSVDPPFWVGAPARSALEESVATLVS